METPKIVVSKEDFIFGIDFILTKCGLGKDSDEVTSVWKKLIERCPQQEPSTQTNNDTMKKELILPPITGSSKGKTENKDICIAFSLQNGSNLARLMKERIEKNHKLSVRFAQDPGQSVNFDAKEIEQRVVNSTSLVVVLTAKCLQQIEVIYAMAVALKYYHHTSLIILVHDAGSCFFPGYDEQPAYLAPIFSEKASTYLSCYADLGIAQIVEKFQSEAAALENALANRKQMAITTFTRLIESTKSSNLSSIRTSDVKEALQESVSKDELDAIVNHMDKNKDGTIDLAEFEEFFMNSDILDSFEKKNDHSEVEEDISTRVFLSHKRSTGQVVVGRLYEGLKDDYKVFLDSEAKFKIHKLDLIVENTECFVFVLSHGIFLSKWCLEELKSAVKNKKQIIVIRELSFSLPEKFPSEWAPYESILRTENELIWMAEYNSACINALKKKIGASDNSVKEGKKALQRIPELAQNLQQGVLDINTHIDVHPDVSIEAIPYLMLLGPPLKQIKLCSDQVKDTHLEFFSKECPNIQNIYLAGCSKITDIGLKYLSQGCHNIQEINLCWCSNITDEGLKYLSQGCPNIQKINFESCLITDTGLKYLFEGCHNIQNINFARCFKITDAGLKYLSDECPNILKLNVYSCWGITSDGLSYFSEKHPSICITNLEYT